MPSSSIHDLFHTIFLGRVLMAALEEWSMQASTKIQILHAEMQKEFAESFKELFEFEIETVRRNDVEKENPNIEKVQRLGIEIYMGKTHARNLNNNPSHQRENVMRLDCPDDLWNGDLEF